MPRATGGSRNWKRVWRRWKHSWNNSAAGASGRPLPSFADPHALGPLQGFRIGGKPFGVQDQQRFARFLCEMAGLSWEGPAYAAAGIDAAALGVNRFAIGDTGQLYVGFDAAGRLVHEDQCY